MTPAERFFPDMLRHFSLQWHITERCNWRCSHCYQESYDTPEMSLQELFGIRNQFIDLLNSFEAIPKAHIQITGGEPLLRTDIMQFLAGIAKHRDLWSWQLMTNGSLIDRGLAQQLARLGVGAVQVSLEGLEATNDAIRGPRAFERTMQAIELLVDAGIRTVVSLTLSKKNAHEAIPLAKFLAPLGVKIFGARRIVPLGNGAEMRDLLLEPKELADFYRQAEDANRWLIDNGHSMRVVGGCDSGFFFDQVRTHPKTGEPLMSKNTCGVRQGRLMVVMPNGIVLPCRRLPIPVGSVSSQTLTEIYHSPAMKRFQEPSEARGACRSCPNLRVCEGGALCVSYGFLERLDIPDVQCGRAFRTLDEARNFAGQC